MTAFKLIMVINLLLIGVKGSNYSIGECGGKYSKTPCLKDIPYNCQNGGQLIPNRQCQSIADCRYKNELNQQLIGNCYNFRCCTVPQIPKCPRGSTYLVRHCSTTQDCFDLNGQCLGGQCCGARSQRRKQHRKQQQTQTICPNGWKISNFICNSNQQCNSGQNGQSRGVCRQKRCCFGGNTQIQGCLSNEINTGQQCWNNQNCLAGSVWGLSTCRNGYCCNSANTNINQPTPVCDSGTAIAASCTHDTQCWNYGKQYNQLATCQNGHCCVATCQNGGKPTGRQCAKNSQDCVYLNNGNYLMGVCDQGTCCSIPNFNSYQQYG